MKAEEIRIETEEDGFHLVVDFLAGPEGDEQTLSFLIEEPDEFYKHVRFAIEPWLRERKDAQRAFQKDWERTHPPGSFPAFSSVPALKEAIRQGIADSGAYELDDPKHPTYHDRMSDAADLT